MNLCLLKLSLVHIHKHTYRGRTREKQVRTSGVCSLKERAILYKSKLFIKAFSDLQLLGWRQHVLLKCLLTSSSQLCLISFSAHSSFSAPLWFYLSYYFLPQDLDICSSPCLKGLALPYSHSHLQAYFGSSIYQILPWISHHGLWCTEHLFCSPCPVDWLTNWFVGSRFFHSYSLKMRAMFVFDYLYTSRAQ